jgi:hypothetical protein
MANAAPEGRQQGEEGGMTIRKPRLGQRQRPQSSSASRFTAGAAGFLILNRCGERPERQRDPKRFDMMPSQPSFASELVGYGYTTPSGKLYSAAAIATMVVQKKRPWQQNQINI